MNTSFASNWLCSTACSLLIGPAMLCRYRLFCREPKEAPESGGVRRWRARSARAPGDLKRRLIDLSCPGFDGKHGFEFDDRQTRAAIGERSVRRFDRCNRSRPPGETTSQRACVDSFATRVLREAR